MSARNVDDLPATDGLILEVLAARARCGERMWPFSSRLRPALRRLEDDGYIGWKSGVVEKTCQAWLLPEGKAAVLDDAYEAPAIAKTLAAVDARWINLLGAAVELNRGDIDLAEFRRRTRPASPKPDAPS